MKLFYIGQRVTCPGDVTGEVVALERTTVLVYLGTYDGARLERRFDLAEIRSNTEQELEDLL